ncbi:MAG: hypothetical protein KatS3mg017_0730 [Fimbriimonadales bacterium]|nr:MAG: hypothetical protein KatS3mg017_0730 [Fimbriimonadales bacterium]
MNEMQRRDMGQLVLDAEEMIRTFFPPRGKSQGDEKGKLEDRGKTQLSNAIDAITQSMSIEVFTNWVCYQTARDDKQNPFWKVSHNQQTFGVAVANYANSLKKKYADKPSEAVFQLTLFLGFLRRAFIAKDYLGAISGEAKES